MKPRAVLMLGACLVSWLALVSPAQGANDVFLSTDVANSEATYVLQFLTTRRGRVDKIMVTFPGMGSGSDFTRRPPSLGRFIVSGEIGQDVDEDVYAERMSVLSADTVMIDVHGVRNTKAGTFILLELFNLHNPAPGAYYVQVQAYDRHNRLVETIAPMSYWTYATAVDTSRLQARVTGSCGPNSYVRAINADGTVSCQIDNVGTGDITAVRTPVGSGLTGGAESGDVTLALDPSFIRALFPSARCPDGSYVGTIDAANGVASCKPEVGDISAVRTELGSGLTGGAESGDVSLSLAKGGVTAFHIASHTIGADSVNADEIQLRVKGSCTTGISQIDSQGTVTCATAGPGGGANVTGTYPVAVTSTPTGTNVFLKDINLGSWSTAVGMGSLSTAGTGDANTALGAWALSSNGAGSDNTATGIEALTNNVDGSNNTAVGTQALWSNGSGSGNTAIGGGALLSNTIGSENTALGAYALGQDPASGRPGNFTGTGITAIGSRANVSVDGLTNATAIGYQAVVDASNKVRIGNDQVTVIQGKVGFTTVSDRNKKENFQPVDGEEVLRKIRNLTVTSWNYIGQDPRQFRHYGPVAQDFFAAFGHDGIGTIGTPTTITSTDMEGILMIAVRALEQRTAELKARDARIKALESRLDALEREIGAFAVPAKFTLQAH